ncbi:pilus assembly protein [Pseudomonas costantinii]|uniref:Pilus assembly protein n=1 Tax=Pseudomonas costantinii TaxID=168469 RepID=A0A1S2V471_9PSED|nr:pilus assembly protein [Pseudomonas costantinii]OIN53165.1 pilus assembly protein [Pseudomonas costantinii]SED20975.1 hypothetical protein SAMN04515675_0266 [Pseudomonas costantinii]
MKNIFLLLCACFFAGVAHAGPQINVGTMYDYLDGDKGSFLKRVFNGGDSTAFVKINVLEIVYNSDGVPEEVPLKSQSELSTRDGLMASPARLIVPANGMQGARLLFMGPRDKERYFRVRFVPVIPEKEDQFAVPEEERQNYEKTLSAGVNVLAGYGTIFFVRPGNTQFNTKTSSDGINYVMRNEGNSVVIVDEFEDCPIGKDVECKATTKHHILPGRSFQFDKQAGREYRFNLIEGATKKAVAIKG